MPFVKVELFDVDREGCWWPWLYKWAAERELSAVVRIPELLKPRPKVRRPVPEPDPPRAESVQLHRDLVGVALAPGVRVGEVAQVDNALAARLEKVTLTSRIAPWLVRPRSFYSRVEVCETTTDCNGFFKCCFDWWPLHLRNGRLRFDSRPDIVVKVTQVLDGVATVVYMDPYSSTRWDVYNAHIDLALDNEEVVCGSGQCYRPPKGSPVFFTRIGNDEVFQVDQTTGLYNDATYKKVAYGSALNVHGQFGDDLTQSDPGQGGPTPYFYYRLSYAEHGSGDADFKLIVAHLSDTRVGKGSLVGESHKLGPYTVNGVPGLYEVRNFSDYYWYNPDWLGVWQSWLAEEDTGKYELRLELFDRNGVKLTTASGQVDYRDGAGAGHGVPPAPLPPMVDHCDLVITLDNKPPIAELTVTSAINDCGVVCWKEGLKLDFHVKAVQENDRLHSWSLYYTKGVGTEVGWPPFSGSSPTGLPGGVDTSFSDGTPFVGLDSTCAYALRLSAWAHIRNGYGFVFHAQDIDAIAIEKCKPQPSCP